MDMERIHETIRVAVIHGPGSRMQPVWFDWKQRKHEVKEITYHWRQFLGSELILHYSVTDGRGLYELVYNATQQVWLLENLDSG